MVGGRGECLTGGCEFPPAEEFEDGLFGWESRGLIQTASGTHFCDGSSPVAACSDLVCDCQPPPFLNPIRLSCADATCQPQNVRAVCNSYGSTLCDGLANTVRENQLGQNPSALDPTGIRFSGPRPSGAGNVAAILRLFRRSSHNYNPTIVDDAVFLTSPLYPPVNGGSLRFLVGQEAADFHPSSNVRLRARLVQEDGQTPVCSGARCSWVIRNNPIINPVLGARTPDVVPLDRSGTAQANNDGRRCCPITSETSFRVQFEHRNPEELGCPNCGFGSFIDRLEVSSRPCDSGFVCE